MTKYENKQKVYVKSDNNTCKLLNRYTYTLIFFTIISLIINALIKNSITNTIKSLIISLLSTIIITYIINIIKKDYDIKKVFLEDNAIAIGLVLGLFTCQSIPILLIAVIITLAIKNIFKNFEFSSVLFGALIITAYNAYILNSPINPLLLAIHDNYAITFKDFFDNTLNYLFGIDYLAPALAITMFIYLFYKKSIKYNIVIYYILTIFLMLLAFCASKEIAWLSFFELAASGLFFLTIYALADYKNSPTIALAQILYGIILGVITVILKFIIPDFAVLVSMIIGITILSGLIERISYKLKYDKKIYNLSIIISITLVIVTTVTLIIIK